KLRPLDVADIRSMGGESEDEYAGNTVCNDKIVLKDFYFSYYKKPYLLFKKRFTAADKRLSLSIPELALPKGAVIGVTGRNGTGKSTFLKCVCGLENDCHGVIVSNGRTYKGKKRLKLCYMVMQDVNHQLFADSVKAEVMISMEKEDDARCDEILENLGISEFKDKHPMALSGGQKQRVAIASAIAADAKLLLFDEPTSGLDFSHMEKVGELLKSLASAGNTVLVSTHDPELIELSCDFVLNIENGRVGYFKKV
ncbi:MAG: ATP-binding cassette domain-containing protein, partial [Lachnospiraceae bacterium]|nr:ATP-binding cassette domain-containing protein [Lachnospiraceae bacterium]